MHDFVTRLYWFVRGGAGYLIDLYRIATLSFRNPHNMTKYLQIRAVMRRTASKIMIEAGTYRGITAARCASLFEHVYTIELDSMLFHRAAHALSHRPNVTVIHGDVLQELPKLMERDDVRASLVYLDGHFSGGITASGLRPEPAADALALLSKHRDKVCAIIIDDFRSFGVECGTPKKSEIMRTSEECFGSEGFDISVHLDQIIIARQRRRV